MLGKRTGWGKEQVRKRACPLPDLFYFNVTPLPTERIPHSFLIAVIGFTFVARRAGK